MFSTRFLMGGVLVLAGAMTSLWAADGKPADSRIWKGVYSEAQAERGKKIYTDHCLTCHGADMKGVGNRAPALVGDRFMQNWENTTANNLFEKLRDTMPASYPDSVSDASKIDAMAFLFKSNGFPAGQTELKLDQEDLDDIQIIRNVAQTAPNFALVRMVGCLTQSNGKTWTLTRSSEPVVTRDETPAQSALKDAGGTALGAASYDLVSVTPFKPESHKGQKVEARGLLYRDSGQNLLNLTSLEDTGGRCGR
jgi:S-disulfanyl-L-cysteine oxidoreductase SoxD